MFAAKPENLHKHTLKKAYHKVRIGPNEETRYIRLRVCIAKGCTYQLAYDLTVDPPGKDE